MKNVIVISDLHCGSQVGLTPPEYQYKDRDVDTSKKNKYAIIQREIWNWYTQTLKKVGKVDLLIVNGDAVDGRGRKTGGTEQITTDMQEQVEIAIECIHAVKAKKIVMTYGTPYHTGDEDDYESLIAQRVGAKIGSHEWIDADGVIFDVKHKVGSSSVPYGRHTAVSREDTWNALYHEAELSPRCHILLRSHVHYFSYCGSFGRLQITTPACQGFGTKYGSRQCSGLVDVGMLQFKCDRGTYDWKAYEGKIERHKAEVYKV